MDDMIRSFPFELVRGEANDGLTLEGYAAVFDSPTQISERGEDFMEVIQRGAFKKTLRERKPVLMFDHGQHPLIGQMPIGTIIKAQEDARGLYISARLFDNFMVQPVRDAIADEAITGMSFRFTRALRDRWDPPRDQALGKGKLRTRTLLELPVPELGPVVFPAYRDTSVSVRGLLDNPALRAELADLLSTFDDAARGGTSSDAAPNTETPGHEGTTSRIPLSERRLRALEIRGVITHDSRGVA
jgi:HK97 family phage prohead protease